MKRATTDDNFDNFYRVISIHALVKRATVPFAFSTFPVFISIHALVKRATLCIYIALLPTFYFNPRPREEGDQGQYGTGDIVGDFNPRPREEGDPQTAKPMKE